MRERGGAGRLGFELLLDISALISWHAGELAVEAVRTVREAELVAVSALPFHHSDPFDRLLIVHAREEGFTILTSDRAFQAWRVPIVLF